jgi:hypothetical protein
MRFLTTVDGTTPEVVLATGGSKLLIPVDSSPGGVASVVAGTGIAVDATDPHNPIVSNTGVLTVTAAPAESPGIIVDNTDPQNPTIQATGILDLTAGPGIGIVGGQHAEIDNLGVLSVVAGNGIAVDNTDPQNPVVSLPTPNVIQGVDSTGGTVTPQYDFAQSFTPGSGGVQITASVTFTPGTPGDIVQVWLEDDASPGVKLAGLVLQSAGDSAQTVTISCLANPTPNVATAFRIFALNTAAGSVTVPPNGTSLVVMGFR